MLSDLALEMLKEASDESDASEYLKNLKRNNGIKYFDTNDGSKYEKLSNINNEVKHFTPWGLPTGNRQPTWITNEGIESEYFYDTNYQRHIHKVIKLSYAELLEALCEVGARATIISTTGKLV